MNPSSSASHSSNPYLNPALAEYLDSFEGITWPQPVEQPAEIAGRGRVRTQMHAWFASVLRWLRQQSARPARAERPVQKNDAGQERRRATA